MVTAFLADAAQHEYPQLKTKSGKSGRSGRSGKSGKRGRATQSGKTTQSGKRGTSEHGDIVTIGGQQWMVVPDPRSTSGRTMQRAWCLDNDDQSSTATRNMETQTDDSENVYLYVYPGTDILYPTNSITADADLVAGFETDEASCEADTEWLCFQRSMTSWM